MSIQGNEVPGILAKTGSYAMTGASVGGPWGAAIGGAIGLGSSLFSAANNNPVKAYKASSYIKNYNPYGGVVQGFPGMEREVDVTEYEKTSKKGELASKIGNGLDIVNAGVGMASSFAAPKATPTSFTDGPASFDYNFSDIAKNKYNHSLQKFTQKRPLIQSAIKPMNTNFQNDVGEFSTSSRLNFSDTEFDWTSVMKTAKKKFGTLEF